VAKEVLRDGVDINAIDEFGRTALYFLAYSRDRDLLLYFFDKCNADPSIGDTNQGWTPRHFAAAGNASDQEKYEVIDVLLEYGANLHTRSLKSESYRDVRQKTMPSREYLDTVDDMEKELFAVYSSRWDAHVSDELHNCT
jgi:ankyrin repeat protein